MNITNPILKKIAENKLRLNKVLEKTNFVEKNEVKLELAKKDSSFVESKVEKVKKINYEKYLKLSVKKLNKLDKKIKKYLQTNQEFLIEYAKINSVSRAISFACKDMLNNLFLMTELVRLEPAVAINKAGEQARKNVELVNLAFQIANRKNLKTPKIPTELQENTEFLVSLIKENPLFVNLLTPRQKKDENLMLTMLKTAPEAKEIKEVITSVHKENNLINNNEFMLSAIEVSPSLISNVSAENAELIQEAVEQNPELKDKLSTEQKEAVEELEQQTKIENTNVEEQENKKFENKKDLDAESSLKNEQAKKKDVIKDIKEGLDMEM